MLRGFTENGSLFIGLVRGPLLDRLLAGERVCLPGHGQHPHVCLFLRDDNAELLLAAAEYFPDGLVRGAVVEYVAREDPK